MSDGGWKWGIFIVKFVAALILLQNPLKSSGICMVRKLFVITDWHYIKRKKKIMHK